MKKIPKWFKLESALIAVLMIVIFIMQSAISIVPGHESDVLRLFIFLYSGLLVIWIISLITILSNGNKKIKTIHR